MKGSGSGEFSGKTRNTSEFGKPTAIAVLGQTKTSLFNQTTQPNTGNFESTNVAPVFDASCQTTNAHPIFEGFNADGTCSMFGTITETSTSIITAPQTSTADNFSTWRKPTTGLCRINTSLFGLQKRTTRRNRGLSTAVATGIGKSGQTPTADPKFKGMNADGTCLLFGTPTASLTSKAGLSEFSGKTRNTSEFGKPTAIAVLGQTKTSLFNQTTQPNTGTYGSINVFGVFGASCQTTNAHPIFEGHATSGFEATSASGTPRKFNPVTGTNFANRNDGQQSAVDGGIFESPKTLFSSTTTLNAGLYRANENNPLNGATLTTAAVLGGSGSGEFSGKARNTSEFGKPTALAELGQTKTSLFNQTTQPNTGTFGSTNVAPVFGARCQTTNAHPIIEGFSADGTCSRFGTPTETSTSNGGLIGRQNASMGEKTGGGFFDSSNSKTSFRQSKPVGTPLAQSTSNIFAKPHSSTAGFNTDGTRSLFGTLTETSTSNGGLFGQQTAGNAIFGTSTTVVGQTKTSLFNQTTEPNTGIFGSTNVAPVFGTSCQTTYAHPIFEGFNADGTCSLFGTPTATSTSNGGLFGQQNASMGGNTGGVCLCSSNYNTSFRQSKPSGTPLAQPTSNIFAAPQTSTGIFGTSTTGHATSGFGATSGGGTSIKFKPVTGTDKSVIKGVIHIINTSHQSITVMKEYETKDFEELRFEYYFANRKVGQQSAVDGGIFESPKTLFSSTTTLNADLYRANENNPLNGATLTTAAVLGDVMTKIQLFTAAQTNIFGTTAPSTFVTQTTGFGQTGFGQPDQNNLFGQNKPAFGLGSTQTTGFGFGTNTFTSAHGLFGSKPNSGFQMTSSAFGTDNTFGAKSTAQPATGGLFGSKAFTEAPTTSLFNQTKNGLTGVFNARSSGKKRKRNTRNEGTGLFGLSYRSSVGTD